MPDTYTLYGSQGSGSAAIEAALDLAGARWRLVRAASWEPGPDFDALLRINPTGLVPTLVLPDGAQAIRGLVFIAAQCYAAIGVIDYPERWCADCDEATAARIRAGTRARLHRMWEIFADTFPARPWLSGAAIGALDLLAAVVSRWSGTRAHLEAARPAFHALLQSIETHPRVASVFARHWPPPEA